MKKIIIIIILIANLSCTNEDSSSSERGNAGLIESIISPSSDLNYSEDITTKFFYTEGNKLKRVEFVSKKNDIITLLESNYFYEGNLIIRIETEQKGNYGISIIDYFEYDSSQRLIKHKRIRNDRNIIENYEYSYMSNGNILKTDVSKPNYSEELKFDNNNNLISDVNYEYTYDNMKSQYFGILGLEKIYFVYFIRPTFNYPVYYNNFITYKIGNITPIKYSYEYNSEGKPIRNNFGTFYNYY